MIKVLSKLQILVLVLSFSSYKAFSLDSTKNLRSFASQPSSFQGMIGPLKYRHLSYRNLKPQSYNGDYLKNVETPTQSATINDFFFKNESAKNLKLQYQIKQNKFEQRENHKQNTMYDYYFYTHENQSMIQNNLVDIGRDQVRDSARSTIKRNLLNHKRKKKLKNDESLSLNSVSSIEKNNSVQTQKIQNTNTQDEDESSVPKEIANFILETQNGTEIGISENLSTELETNTLKGQYRFQVKSDLIKSGFLYRTNPINPIGRNRLSANDERAMILVDRDLTPLKAQASSRYGLIQKQLSYGIRKNLIDNLDATVFRNEFLQDRTRSETVYGLNYSLHF
jgi:hypothetical protein